MNLAEDAYQMPTGMLLLEAGRQFAMAEIVRDGWQRVLYERGCWFLLLVHAERTAGVTQGEAPPCKFCGVYISHPPCQLANALECQNFGYYPNGKPQGNAGVRVPHTNQQGNNDGA